MSVTPPLNLGVLAHVDADKTSLTERLLYEAGALDVAGSVDSGTTRTDSLELERRRGITIRAAVTSFASAGVTVNLVDTPGHPDFIAEVEQSLSVLDAAVLVLSAVEGVQPQSIVLWRALRELGLPTVLFVNKVDRLGADVAAVLEQVRRRLTDQVVALARVEGEGSATAVVRARSRDDSSVLDVLADHDHALLTRLVEHGAVPPATAAAALADAVTAGLVTPVLCGSAVTGAGVALLRDSLVELLRRPGPTGGPGEPLAEVLSGVVFAVDRDEHGRRAWVRMWSGTLRVRDRLALPGRAPGVVTELVASTPDGPARVRRIGAGDIGFVRGPVVRVGDVLGVPSARAATTLAPPGLQAVVEPIRAEDRGALFAGLTELGEEDPLIDVRLDTEAGEVAVSLHGEVQKEVVAAWLADRYGVPVRFLEFSVVCLERVLGTGAAEIAIDDGDCPYLAGLGLRVTGAPPGSGVTVSPGVERRRLVPALVAAAEEGVRTGLEQGRYGWRVTDCVVTLTSSAYYPRQSRPHQGFDKSVSTVATDFRQLAPVVLHRALDRAGTRVVEPVHRFDLELPEDALGPASGLLGRWGATVLDTVTSPGLVRLRGRLPAARIPELTERLPDLAGGEAVLATRPDTHVAVRGTVPVRRRVGPDPLDPEAWYRARPR